jgi:hypothetical protein
LAATDEGELHGGGGMVGEVEGNLWMRQRVAAVGGCDKRGGGGGRWGVCGVSSNVLC